MRMLIRKKRFVFVVVAAACAIAAAGALAAFPADNVTHYTGCLSTGGSAAGTFSQVAVGDEPARPCGINQALVRLSGGDITSVNAGAGLTGGSENGAATLALAAGQALPQTCTGSQIPKWNGSGWSCGDDNDTTYSNGTGLDLNSNTFSVSTGYRLPQSCSNGEVAKSNGSGSWNCAGDNGGLPRAYAAENIFGAIPNGDLSTIATLNIPSAGTYFVTAKLDVYNSRHDTEWHCSLTKGDLSGPAIDEADTGTEKSDLLQGDWQDGLALEALTTFSAAGTVTLACSSEADSDSYTRYAKIIAVTVAR